MDTQLTQLQATLREIEHGARLERLDGILVQRVLQKPVRQRQQQSKRSLAGSPELPEESVSAKDAYRALLELRRSKKQQLKLESEHKNQQDVASVSVEPARTPTGPAHHFDTPTPITQQHQQQHANRHEPFAASKSDDDSASDVLRSDMAMLQRAIRAREKELALSHAQVQQATTQLQTVLEQTQALLPSRFLFERNLTELCQERSLEVVRNVLLRFHHRFFTLYFSRWRSTTLELRRAAHARAASTITRAFRGHCGRKIARQVRRQFAERQRQAATLLDFRIKYREHQAVKIQMAWRRSVRRRAVAQRQQRRASVVYLQRLFRDRRLRRNHLVHALLHVRKIMAAIVIQKHFRGHHVRRQVRAELRRQKRERLVAAILARSLSNEALLQWKLDRQGAAFLICTRAVYPFAVKRRLQSLVLQTRRQRAALIIARRVCRWFGVSTRREEAQARQLQKWLRALAVEQQRTRAAALLIQKHLRRWVQQRKFEMATTRTRKLARKQRLADKAARLDRMRSGKEGMAKSQALVSPSKKAPAPPKLTIALKGIRLRDTRQQHLEDREAEAATTIQRCYRRHKRFVQFLRRHWREEAVKVDVRVLRRRRAAVAIQRRVRGRQARQLYRRMKAEKLLLAFVVAWKWKVAVKLAHAARKICRWIKQRRTQHVAQLWRLERRRQHAMATRIQRLWRRRLAFCSKLSTLLSRTRKREETALFCRQSLRVCTQHLTDELIFASLTRGFEESIRAYVYPTKAAKHHAPRQTGGLFFPIVQMVFLAASGAKDPSKWRDVDERALLQTKLERSRVVALFKSVNKHYQDSKSAAGKGLPKAKSKAAFFSMTDVDLTLAKAGGASKRPLTFEEFGHVLRLLAELKLASRVQLWWSRYEGSDAQLFALLWDFVFVLPDMVPLVQLLSAFVLQELNKRCERIQHLFQRGRNLRRGLLARLERRRLLEAQAQSRAATLLQARVRVLLAKKQHKLRVQEVYEKYIDPEWGLPYWTNPKTGYSTWEKPRVLRAEDVRTEVVPYPRANETLKLACDGVPECSRCAEWFCYDCAEFFCVACLPVFHTDKSEDERAGESSKAEEVGSSDVEKTTAGDAVGDSEAVQKEAKEKKRKSEHETEKIELCGLCQFQVASRKCLSCLSSSQPRLKQNSSPPGAALSSGDVKSSKEREALFCDACFAFTHRRGGLTVHKSVELLETCSVCTSSDDDLDVSSSSSSSSPSKTHENKSTRGMRHAVQWQCEHCEVNQRVCGRCVSTSHPPEVCGGDPKRVRLQTLAMVERARKIAEELEARDRADVEKMRLRSVRARRERCARRIQKFWRARIPIVRAKRVVAKLKQSKQERWLQHQADAKREKQFVYLARSFLGIAKPLPTDSVVRRKLREMNALQRRQLAIRARMFGLLVHEYMRVGIPLPGIGRTFGGSHAIDTTEDLRGWVKSRQTIRLKRITIDPSAKRTRTLENLSSWHHLANWDHESNESLVTEGSGGGGDMELLVDVAVKETITERRIPLAQPLRWSGTRKPDKVGRDDGGGEAAEDEQVFVMYLVEYSMDPSRVVWINHSLYVCLYLVEFVGSSSLLPNSNDACCSARACASQGGAVLGLEAQESA